MTLRSLSLVSLLAVLAIGGWLLVTQLRTTGPTSDSGKRAQGQASAGAAATNFQAAFPVMQAYYAEHGTYTGVALPPSYGAVVVRADDSSYCLQAGMGASAQHVIGPGGAPAPGAC